MTSLDRKKLQLSLGTGFILMVLIALSQLGDLFEPLDNYIYDQRARRFQMFMPQPTDRLVHLDITDRDLRVIGLPPWPRSLFGELSDTLREAGAVAIGFDLILSEPKPSQDVIFADAIRKWDHALIPAPFELKQPLSPLVSDLKNEYLTDLEVDSDADEGAELTGRRLLVARMRDLGHRIDWAEDDTAEIAKVESVANLTPVNSADESERIYTRDAFENACIAASRLAIYDRIRTEMSRGEAPSREELRRTLLPRTPLHVNSAIVGRFNEMFEKVQSMQYLERLAISATKASPSVVAIPAQVALLPVPTLSAAASTTGFVDFPPEKDGVLRRLPLISQNEDYLFPQFGLSLACATLGVDVRDIRIEHKRVVIPQEGKPDIVLPTHTRRIPQQGGESVAVNVMLDVPYFGPAGEDTWMTMYDWPDHRDSAQHLPVTEVWEIIDNKNINETTNGYIDNIIEDVLVRMDPAWLERYKAETPPLSDTDARAPVVERLISEVIDFVLESVPDPSVLEGEDKEIFTLLQHHKTDLQQMIKENRQREKEIESQMAFLKRTFHGKTVILGWTATGIAADFVPTPLHQSCPGAVVHGAMFNAIMSGEIWQRAPEWVPFLLTIFFAVIAAVIATFLGPAAAALATASLFGVYVLIDGVLLFDYGNIVLDSAGPLGALWGVWAGVTTTSYITDMRERGRITKRFGSYVDPKLVEYVLEHDEDVFAGQEREMTVVFTDLAGFTSLTEKLGAGVVPVLNEYIELVVPIITVHNGLVNKFLGDGVMFFYNAPLLNPAHAKDAVVTAFEMQEALVGFNKRLEARGLPTVAMRVGINTDYMIVGDAGGAKRADYTVLGDSVNLAARLESANKQTGTLMMVGERTAELVRDDVLLRPLGSLQVVGKTRGVKVFEPVATHKNATEEQRRFVAMTERVISAYEDADFETCLTELAALEKAFSETKLTKLYHELCEQFMKNPPEMPFHGSIVLTSK